MTQGYNILVPDICRDAMPEVTLPAMDAMQTLGHLPVILDMQKVATMYQEYRYAKHGCYEIFLFYYKDLLRENRIDFGFSTGLLGVMEDLGKAEAHNLLEEAGVSNLLFLHCRDRKPVKRLIDMGAAGWQYTFVACSTPELAADLNAAGVQRAYYAPPATSPRLFFPAECAAAQHPYPVLQTDDRLAKGFEVCFAGNWTAGRESLLASLLQSGTELAVFGDSPWSRGDLSQAYRGPANYLTELNTVYNSAKVVLDLPHEGTECPGYISSRVIDALAAGACLLSYAREPFAPILQPQRDLAVYQEAGDLPGCVARLLENEVERHRLASAGHQRVVNTCTWSTRLAGLLPMLEIQSLRAS